MKRTMYGLGVAALVAMSFVAASAQAPAPFKRTMVQEGELSMAGRVFAQAVAEVQPNAQAGRHTHPGEEIGYVLAGPVVVEIDGQPGKTLQTGEAFLIPAGKIHNAKNNGTGVAKILGTYIIEKGKPLATPVQ